MPVRTHTMTPWITHQPRRRNVTTADFVAVAEEIAERDLDALFDAWLYAERTPPPPD